MNPEKSRSSYGTSLGAWVFLGTEQNREKPVGLMVICEAHAILLLAQLERARLETGHHVGEIRLVREGVNAQAQELVLSLRQHEAQGENKCARCHADDWESAEMWGPSPDGSGAVMLAQFAAATQRGDA